MPNLERPDGAVIHWREWGEGPLVVVLTIGYSAMSSVEGLVAELARDHRVVHNDLRGTGESSRTGPYDFDTDVDDLEAVLEEVDGGRATAVCVGDGIIRAIALAARRPDLIAHVVSSGVIPLSAELSATEGLVASGGVLKALVQMFDTDYRSALRSIMTSGNWNLSEEQIRERVAAAVERCPQEPAAARMREWIDADVTAEARELGDRLTFLHYPGNDWFPESLIGPLGEALPEARFVPVEEGAMSRPDLVAPLVRELTVAQ